MSDAVDIVVQGRTLISQSHPHRAVRECLAGFACYESAAGVPDQVSSVPGQSVRYAARVGITDEAGARQFLRGETPHVLDTVEEPS